MLLDSAAKTGHPPRREEGGPLAQPQFHGKALGLWAVCLTPGRTQNIPQTEKVRLTGVHFFLSQYDCASLAAPLPFCYDDTQKGVLL